MLSKKILIVNIIFGVAAMTLGMRGVWSFFNKQKETPSKVESYSVLTPYYSLDVNGKPIDTIYIYTLKNK